LRRLSFECRRGGLSRDAKEAFIAVPGAGELLALDDPKGTAIELFCERSYLGAHHQVLGAGPLKLGHVAHLVQDPQATADFYCRVIASPTGSATPRVFLRCNPDQHTVIFFRGRRRRPTSCVTFSLGMWPPVRPVAARAISLP
jgi:hypothetical protein